jgi:hypothetical protein
MVFSKHSTDEKMSVGAVRCLVLIVSFVGYVLGVAVIEGSTLNTRLTYLIYLPATTAAVYFYFVLTRCLAQYVASKHTRVIVLMAWIMLGAVFCYLCAMAGAFLMLFIAKQTGQFTWIRSGSIYLRKR